MMFHRSERLFLRPAWPEDWQQLFGGIADEGVVRNLARAPWPYTEDHARDFVSRADNMIFPRFLLTLPHADGGRADVVGCIGLDATDKSDSDADLGYWIARSYWGRGIATEAAHAALEVAAMLGHRTVSAGHYLDNPASGNVLRKAGFVPTGRTEMVSCLARGETLECALYRRNLSGMEAGLKAA